MREKERKEEKMRERERKEGKGVKRREKGEKRREKGEKRRENEITHIDPDFNEKFHRIFKTGSTFKCRNVLAFNLSHYFIYTVFVCSPRLL